MNPKTVDWKMFLGTEFGLAPDQPFNRAKLRPVALLLGLRRRHVHRPVRPPAHPPDPGDGRPLPAPGRRRRRPLPRVRRPRRARRGDRRGRLRRGLPGHHHGDDVQRRPARRGDPRPHRHDQVRRGDGFDVIPQKLRTGRPAPPGANKAEGGRARQGRRPAATTTPAPSGTTSSSASARGTPRPSARPRPATPRSPRSTWASQSYREGKAYYFDKETGKVSEADESWAKKWEKMSQERGKPNQVMGWNAGDDRLACSTRPTTRSSKATGSTARTPPRTPEPRRADINPDRAWSSSPGAVLLLVDG